MKKIVFVIMLLPVLFLVSGFLLPSHWEVVRSEVIAAPAEAIYPLVANFKTGWAQWSAFDYQDKTIVYTYAGPDLGAGATRSWVSKKMGDGAQTILKADPQTGIEFRLDMNGFSLNGELRMETTHPGETRVTWRDYGEAGMNPVRRWMVHFLDKMMGGTFERSLATLKRIAEKK